VTPPRSDPGDAKLLATLERAFEAHAKGEARIDRAKLQAALGLRSEYLAGRVLAAFDRDGDGTIDRDEFLAGARALVAGTDREKLAFAFKVHDHDGDGALGYEELLRMIAIAMGESDLGERATQPAEHLARVLLARTDTNRDGKVTLDELEAAVRARPDLLWQMTRSEAAWIAPNEDLLARLDARAIASAQGTVARYGDDARLRVALVVLAAANVALFLFTLLRAPLGVAQSAPMHVGRALGKCADLDGALILVPMLRRLLTRVRASALGRALPIDDAIDLHRILGHALFAVAVAHSAAFVAAYAMGHGSRPAWQVFATSRGATGVALLAVFAVMWGFSLSFVRRSSRFELFYFTHLLYVAWLAIAIAHAPSFLLWAGVPVLGLALEQGMRRARRAPESAVLAAEPLRSGVVRLEVARPPGFAFQAGDYAFLRLPTIAKREWHPFTISSAPERDVLVFHVRSLGNWSGALRRAVERDPSALGVAHVDGPYGSPSGHVFRSRFPVLIGAGIGVTPFASILESIVLRASAPGAEPTALERVAFFWVNRDRLSFEWFASLLADLEKQDTRGLVDFHLCMDGARGGATAIGLELAREAMRASGRSDLITGLRTHTHLGPPDWATMLGAIAKRHHPARVDVFFCGPRPLATKLRPLCAELGMAFREERF
jgi:predicted ferric reductase/Ca2+-binding EF-hand superfamily protein